MSRKRIMLVVGALALILFLWGVRRSDPPFQEDRLGVWTTLVTRAVNEIDHGNFADAEEFLSQSLCVAQRERDLGKQGISHFNLGDVALRQGRWELADQHLQRAIDELSHSSLRQSRTLERALRYEARVALELNRFDDVASLIEQANQIRRKLEAPSEPPTVWLSSATG